MVGALVTARVLAAQLAQLADKNRARVALARALGVRAVR
jgi:hypothetical protein